MSRGKYITKEQIEKILLARTMGEKSSATAKRLGVSYSAVRKIQSREKKDSGGGSTVKRIDEMENAPRPRGESMKIDLKDKLPKLPEGYNLDGTPKAHFPAPACQIPAEGDQEGDRGRIASLPEAARNDKNRDAEDGTKKQAAPEKGEEDRKPAGAEAAPDEKAKGAEVIPFKGLVPLGTLKAEAEEGTERRMERTVWCKGKWVQMEIRDGKCQFAFVKEPMMQGELILDALNAIVEISEEICEAAHELAAEEKRMLNGRK